MLRPMPRAGGILTKEHGFVIRYLVAVAGACLTVGVGATVAVTATAVDGLPAGPGHDTFVRVCSACHAPDIVMDKRLDRAGWEETVQMMIGRGATASESETEEIIDYLAKAYPARAEADRPQSGPATGADK